MSCGYHKHPEMSAKELSQQAIADEKGGEPDTATNTSLELPSIKDTEAATSPLSNGYGTFPEGGGRAWSVACGAAGIMFCSFGYINAFG